MASRSRRLALVAALVVALVLPIEIILVQAISEDQLTAAESWVADLSEATLQQEADRIEDFPIPYRHAMLNRLGPEVSAKVWNRYLDRTMAAHPEWSDDQVGIVKALMAFITPELFSFPTDKDRETVTVIADRMLELFGPDVRRELLRNLGPDRVFFSAQAVSLPQRIEDFVREHFVVRAGDGDLCSCASEEDCGGKPCDDGNGCSPKDEWYACGFLGLFTCTGMCEATPAGY